MKTGTSAGSILRETPTDATWILRTQNYNVDPEHVREVFQDLVNAGFFDKDKMFKSTKFPRLGGCAVRAAIDNKTSRASERFSRRIRILPRDCTMSCASSSVRRWKEEARWGGRLKGEMGKRRKPVRERR